MKLPKNCKIEKATSTDSTRPAIGEPWLDVEAGKLVATNGRIIAVVPVEIEEGDASGYVTAEALKAARALVGKHLPLAIKANGSLALYNGVTFPRPGVDDLGQFPNWKQVIPEKQEKPAIRIAFDVKLLSALCEAMGTSGVILEASDDLTGIRVIPTGVSACQPGSPQAFGVIMPLRCS